jgi:hypothetical protein
LFLELLFRLGRTLCAVGVSAVQLFAREMSVGPFHGATVAA